MNIAWSRDVDEVLGTHTYGCRKCHPELSPGTYPELVAFATTWEIESNSVGNGSDQAQVAPGQLSYVARPLTQGFRQNSLTSVDKTRCDSWIGSKRWLSRPPIGAGRPDPWFESRHHSGWVKDSSTRTSTGARSNPRGVGSGSRLDLGDERRVGTRQRVLWVPKMSSGYVEVDFRGLTHNDKTGPWLSRFSTVPSSESSSCSAWVGVTATSWPTKHPRRHRFDHPERHPDDISAPTRPSRAP
jgi:hypothetical protein